MAHERTTFFKIDRKLLESEWWVSEPFSKPQAWVDLIGLANYGDVKRMEGEKMVTYARGQVVTSVRTLALRWQWSREKVRNYLAALASDDMATTKKTGKGIVISLANYGFYQDAARQKDQQTDNRPTTDRQLTDNRPTQNKNNKNTKNTKKSERGELRSYGPGGRLALTPSEMDQFLLDYPKDGQRYIEELDEYKGATGKKYQNDCAALRRWARNDQKYQSNGSSGRYKSGAEKVWEDIDNGGTF